jgi:hypothetical protein
VVQRLRRVLTVTLTVCGAAAMASPATQAQDGLPAEGGMITLVGCFLPAVGHHSKYVLAKPIMGSVVSVTDGTCSAPIDETAVELKDIAGKHHGEGMVNHLIEVTGRLEKFKGTTAASTTTADSTTDARDLREVHVRSFTAVPVVIPTPAASPEVRYIPAPQPQAAIPPLPDQPVATSGTVPTEVPETASSLPLFGLISLLSLSGALSLHLVGRRRRE